MFSSGAFRLGDFIGARSGAYVRPPRGSFLFSVTGRAPPMLVCPFRLWGVFRTVFSIWTEPRFAYRVLCSGLGGQV